MTNFNSKSQQYTNSIRLLVAYLCKDIFTCTTVNFFGKFKKVKGQLKVYIVC